MSNIGIDLYREIHANMPILCVDLMILVADVRDYNLIVGKRNNEPCKDEYCLPGGRVHKGESLAKACSRIARDEVGLGIPFNSFKWVSLEESIFPTDPFGHGKGTHTVSIVFTATVTQATKMVPNEQHSKLELFPKDGMIVSAYVKRLYELLTSKKETT